MPSPAKYIERIHMSAEGFGHEHIEEFEYRYGSETAIEHATPAVLALLIDEYGWVVRAGNSTVQIVRPYGRAVYLRGFIDEAPTNDLLDLPRY